MRLHRPKPARKVTLFALVAILVGCQSKLRIVDAPQVATPACERLGMGENGIDVLTGPEDIAVDSEENVAYISVTDRWNLEKCIKSKCKELPAGGIYRLKYEKDQASVTPMILVARDGKEPNPAVGGNFYPHGIYFYRGEGQKPRLFVVNHPLNNWVRCNFVDVFEISGHQLERVATHPFGRCQEKEPQFNDVVAVESDKFYVTKPWLKISIIGDGDVQFFDGREYRTVIDGLAYPNGINVSRNGNIVYVAASRKNTVSAYYRNRTDGSLTFLAETPRMNGLPDNLEMTLDAHGEESILVAVHRNGWINGLRFALHASFGWASPSEVLQLPASPEKLKDPTARRLFLDEEGTQNPGSSVAVFLDKNLLIGNVFKCGVLLCKKTGVKTEASSSHFERLSNDCSRAKQTKGE